MPKKEITQQAYDKLMEQKVGSQLTIKTPQGESEIKILEIR